MDRFSLIKHYRHKQLCVMNICDWLSIKGRLTQIKILSQRPDNELKTLAVMKRYMLY